MNENFIEDLFALIQEGFFDDVDSFKEYVEEQGTDDLFPLIQEGFFDNEDSFNEYITQISGGTAKKKSPSTAPIQDTESVAVGQEQIIQQEPSSSGLASPLVETTLTGEVIEEPIKDPVGTRYGANVEAEEKNTWLEEMLGKNMVTDYFGDMYRAAQQGMAQGATVDDALNLFARGSTISEEDLSQYVDVVNQMDSVGMSDEMKSFNKIYEENGGGIMGFMYGVAKNPTVINQLLISSFVSMVNPAVAAGAGVGAATGAGAGAAAGAISGPGAILTATGGAIGGALMGAGATLETGLSFTNFLKEEVEKKGLEFNNEGIRQTLEDEDAVQSIRNRAAARGIAIGVVDGITRGVAGKVAGTTVKAAKAAGKAVSKAQKGRAALTAAGIEAIGGSTGEIVGRAVAGEEMDVAEIGFEGITGQASSLISVPQAVTGKTAAELLGGTFKPRSYGLKDKAGGVTKMSKEEIEKFVDTATPEEIRTMQFEIKNDPALEKKIQDKKQAAQIDLEIPDFITGEDRVRMVELEQEKANMQDKTLEVNKKRISDIDAELKSIVEKNEQAVKESTETVDVENIEDVKEVNPTTRYKFKFEEGTVPPEYQALEPQTKGTLTIGKGKDQKTVEQFTVSGQELIDAGLATEAAPTEQVTAETTLEETTEPAPIVELIGDENEDAMEASVRHEKSVEKELDEYDRNLAEKELKRTDLTEDEILDFIDEKISDLSYPEPKALYEKRDAPYRNIIRITSDRVKNALGSLKADGVLFRLGINNPDTTPTYVLNEKLTRIGNKLKKDPRYVSKLLFNSVAEQLAESRGLDYEGIMGPDSGLSKEQQDNFNKEVLTILKGIEEALLMPVTVKDVNQYSLKSKADAVQESSTAQVDVQEPAQDSGTLGEGDQGAITETGQAQDQAPVETLTQAEMTVNVAPFYDASIESTAEAAGIRKTPQYKQYVQGLKDLATDLGVEIEIDESIGGFKNDQGTKVREASNVVRLKNATIDQASQYAAMSAALAPEVQESSIAAEYTDKGAENHNGDEITIRVSDNEGTFQALQEAGIDDYTLNESNNSLTLLDIFEFRDANLVAKLNKLLNILEEKNITYEVSERQAINSRYIGRDSRKQILSDGRQSAIQQKQEGTSLYQKIIQAINRDAESRGISPSEYIAPPQVEQRVTADPARVQRIIDDIDKKTKGRRVGSKTNPKAVLRNITEYLQTSKLYEQLNDIERDALMREINERYGVKMKRPPSVKKILGAKDKKVTFTVNERLALKEQIRMQAKAARQSAVAYKKAMQKLATEIKSLKKSGKISPAKVTAITSRFANVNLQSKKSVDSFLKFVDNIFTKADLAEKINKANKLRKSTRKNIKTKLGVVDPSLRDGLQQVLGFNPSIIPMDMIDSYLSLVEELGARREVLDLSEKSLLMEQVNEIINSVEEEVTTDDNLALDDVKLIDDYDVDENVSEIADMEITDEQINNIYDKRSREIARELRDLTPAEIKDLAREKKDGTMDYSAIETLRKVKQNIQNGYVPKAAIKLVNKVDINKRKKKVMPKIKKVKKEGIYRNVASAINKIKAVIRKDNRKNRLILERIRNNPTFNIDDIFGNFNDRTLYNNSFGRLGAAFQTYTSAVKKTVAKVQAAEKLLEFDGIGRVRKATGVGRSRNAVVKAKYKIYLLQLLREHLSNFKDGKPNKKAPSPLAFLNETINADLLGDQDIKILEELRAEFLEDGEISLQKLEDSLSAAEKKALALYDEANGELAELALFASTMFGSQVEMFNNYVHHVVLDTGKDAIADVVKQANKYVDTVNASTKAKLLTERSPGAKPISFDPSLSTVRAAQQIYMDYYMTQTLQQVGGLANQIVTDLNNDPSSTKMSKIAAESLSKAMKEVVKNVFVSSYSDTGLGGIVNKTLKRAGYQAALTSLPRAFGELLGNLFVFLKNPVKGVRAMKNWGRFTANPNNNDVMFEFMTKVQSRVTDKVVDADVLQSKYSGQSNFFAPTRRAGQAVSGFENVLGMISKISGVSQLFNATNKLSNKILTAPDKVVSRPMWFGSFTDAFKQETGIQLTKKDIQEMADGTSKYLGSEYKAAIEKATQIADKNLTIISTSSNPFDTVIRNQINPDDSQMMRFYKSVNSYMANFTLFEFSTARNAVGALYRRGEISRAEATATLTTLIMRMTSYMVVYATLSNLLDEELFDVKDENREDDDIEDMLVRQLVGSVSTLLFGGSLGNMARIPVNLALEYGINEKMLEDYRKGEYDPYVHSMVFSQLSMDDLTDKDLPGILIKLFSGPYGPLTKTLVRAFTVAQRSVKPSSKPETRQKYKDELENRIAIEMLGNLGMIPFYKDVRRIILKDMFGKKKLSAAEIKALEEYLREEGGVMQEADVIEDKIDSGSDVIGGDIIQQKDNRTTKKKRKSSLSKGL